MIRQLVKRLGLDRVEEYITEEMRRVKLEVLQEERRVVASLLARIEGRLASLGGAPRRRKRRAAKAAVAEAAAPKQRRGKRGVMRARKPGESLSDFILKAAAKAGKPMKASDLVDRVKELGYKSVAKAGNLLTSIYKVLGDKAIYHRVEAGVYELKKRAAAAAGQEKE